MKKSIQKYLILSFLFFFPIFIYIFLASGINNFAKLPILTTNVLDIENIKGNEKEITLKDNISILGFWGGDVNLRKSEALNLNQKIYKRFSDGSYFYNLSPQINSNNKYENFFFNSKFIINSKKSFFI